MATEYLTIPKADLQAKLLVLSPPDFNLAVVAENATDYFCSCTSLSNIAPKVSDWLQDGDNFEDNSELGSATVIPPGFTQVGFPGQTVPQITNAMNAIVTPV